MRGRWGGGRWPRLLAAPLLVAGALAVLGPAAGASAASCFAVTGGQPPSPGGPDNVFRSVTVLSACDAWAVGFDRTGPERQTLTERWDGASWHVVPSPDPGTGNNELHSVRAAAHNDVWAVGSTVTLGGSDAPLIEHWNGSAWSVAQLPSLGGPSELSGVRVVSARNVWAVGFAFDPATNIEQTLILHWDGSSWARVASPDPGPPGTEDALTGIAATSASSAWAVGQAISGGTASPLILRWNGRTWSPAKLPPLGTSASLTGIAATSAGNAWAVGQDITGTAAVTLVLHWDGQTWSRAASPHPGAVSELTAVTATSAASAFAVGDISNGQQSLILHWNGTTWSRVASPSPGRSNQLTGVAAASASSAWAVGFTDTPGQPESVLALHCC